MEADMSNRFTRRNALQALGATGVLSAIGCPTRADTPQDTDANPLAKTLAAIGAQRNEKWQGSLLGNQYPFIKHMQEEAPQSLAFLNVRPKDLEAWKAEARAK